MLPHFGPSNIPFPAASNPRAMKAWFALLAASLLLALTAHANPGAFREPRRVIGNRQFDLTLLFNWWEKTETAPPPSENTTNPPAPRPLPGWYKVTATEIRDGGSVWIIKGIISSSPTNSRPYTFCLAHPPINERAAFLAAVNQLSVATQDHANAARSAWSSTEATREYAAKGTQIDYFRRHSEILYWDLAHASAANNRAYYRARAAAEDAKADATEAIKRTQSAEAVLANFKNTTFYEFDHFVYATGQLYNGLPLFDTGLIGH